MPTSAVSPGVFAAFLLQPGYLGSQGLAARGLLPSTDPHAALQDSASSAQVATVDTDADSSSLLEDVSAWAADRVEGVGFAVVRLGRWMRSKLTGQQGEKDTTASSSSTGAKRSAEQMGDDGASMRRVGGGTLAAVMVAMVAIISVVLLKKPVTLRRLAQVMRAK